MPVWAFIDKICLHYALKGNEIPTLVTFRGFCQAEKNGDFYNPRLRHQDEPISQQGQAEARNLWSYLCDKEISAIYVSGYVRTSQTIQEVAAQSGITSARLPQLEIDMVQSCTVGHASSVTMPDIVTSKT